MPKMFSKESVPPKNSDMKSYSHLVRVRARVRGRVRGRVWLSGRGRVAHEVVLAPGHKGAPVRA